MRTIAFLACDATLPSSGPSSGERRGDAFEHDLMIAALEPECAARGLELRVLDWEAPLADFAGLELALLGTAWNYQDRSDAFLEKIAALEAAGVQVCNPGEVVRWNITKTYLRELGERGARVIPTLWLDSASADDLRAAIAEFDTDKLVVKRQIGAGAEGQMLVKADAMPDADWRYDRPAMVQPFLPAIAEEGEFSFIFIGGAFSHAVQKRAASGDYRIQSLYGGLESDFTPSAEDRAAAKAVVEALPFAPPLYARIDMVRADCGGLTLMEAELIEPYLYPEQGPELGAKLAQAIVRKLDTNDR